MVGHLKTYTYKSSNRTMMKSTKLKVQNSSILTKNI